MAVNRILPYLHLNTDEKILWKGKLSWGSLCPLLLIGVLTIWIYGIGVIFIAYAVSKWARITYIITDQRILKVVEHYAFLKTEIEEMDRVGDESISISRTLGGKLCKYWKVEIDSGGKKIMMDGITEPEEIRNLLSKKQ